MAAYGSQKLYSIKWRVLSINCTSIIQLSIPSLGISYTLKTTMRLYHRVKTTHEVMLAALVVSIIYECLQFTFQ